MKWRVENIQSHPHGTFILFDKIYVWKSKNLRDNTKVSSKTGWISGHVGLIR